MNVLSKLDEMKIQYDIIEHQPVYTVEDAYVVEGKIEGLPVKNLFLKDKNNNFYIYVLEDNKKADFKLLKEKLGTRLEFGTPEELFSKLKLYPGSVAPLGIINDNGSVKLIFDKDVVNKKILIHPNRNTATISIEYVDLVKFLNLFKNSYTVV
ncbi:MAG: YbaK/EbsC family protein [Clostridia bacterium]|nr:YbaK/EbsC family protein [Clostridia bacterium]